SSSSSSRVTVRDRPAMSRLVTCSPTSGRTTVRPASARSREACFHTTNISSYFTVPRPLSTTATRSESSSGVSSSTPSTRILASSCALGIGCSSMPGSPWMPRPIAIVPSGTWNRASSAPGRVQPSKATPSERVAAVAVAVVTLLPRGDVVADRDDAHVDALGAQLLCGGPEVEHVPRVVAEAEDHPAAAVSVAGHRVDLVGRRRGEDVPARGSVGEAPAHPAGEGRIVAGAPADDQRRLPGRGRPRPHHAAVHAQQLLGMGRHQAFDGIGGKGGRVVEQVGHSALISQAAGRGGSSAGAAAQAAVYPPSIERIEPVTKLLASDARYTAAPASSS